MVGEVKVDLLVTRPRGASAAEGKMLLIVPLERDEGVRVATAGLEILLV